MATTGSSLGIALGLDAAIALIIILLFGFFRLVPGLLAGAPASDYNGQIDALTPFHSLLTGPILTVLCRGTAWTEKFYQPKS